MFDPNDCPYLAEVVALWEEELSVERAAEMRAHAASCPECRAELRELQELRRYSEVLRAGDPAAPLPAASRERLKGDLLRRAAADLRPAPAPRPRIAPGWLPWLGFAAAAGALVVTLPGLRPQRSPAPEMVQMPSPHLRPLPPEAPHRAAPVDHYPVTPPRPEPVLVRAAPARKPTRRPNLSIPRAERRFAAAPAEPAPRERVVIDVQVPPQPELPPSGTLTLIATGATGASDATRVILRTVEEETP